jgi:hypothetical protein
MEIFYTNTTRFQADQRRFYASKYSFEGLSFNFQLPVGSMTIGLVPTNFNNVKDYLPVNWVILRPKKIKRFFCIIFVYDLVPGF